MRSTISKSVACSLFFALALVVPAPPAAAGEGLEARLIANEKASWEGWKSADPAPFEEFLADTARVILGDGTTMGKAAVLETIASGDCEVAGYELSGFQLAALGDDAAILTYLASQDAVCKGEKIPPKLVVSSVWSRVEGRWWNVLYQETVVHAHE